MYLTMIIGILLLGAIAGGYSVYDGIRERKEKALKEEQEKKIKEETLRAYRGEKSVEVVSEADSAEDMRGIRLADLVEFSLRRGEEPFVQRMKYTGRDGDYHVVAVDSDDNIYIIETELKPEYEDMVQQVQADVDHYRARMQKKADERMTYVYVCTNHPSKPIRKEAYENRNVRIFNYRVKFQPYRVKH